MLLCVSLLLYLAGLLVIIRVLRGLHDRDEVMNRIYSSWHHYHRTESTAPGTDRVSNEEHAIQVH